MKGGTPVRTGRKGASKGSKFKIQKLTLGPVKKKVYPKGDHLKRDAVLSTPATGRHGVKFVQQRWNGDNGSGKATSIINARGRG